MDLEHELESRFGIETQPLLQRLFHALQTFIDFPVGDYLLQNDAEKCDYVKIYVQTNEM